LVVVGSVNADIYVEIERLPTEGETIAASSGQTLPGGKGANQAACAASLSYPTYFCGQVGDDANAALVKDALATAGVRLDHVKTVNGPTGHAVVMLQPGGTNSIIIVGGANVAWPTLEDGKSRLTTNVQDLIKRAGAVLLQREIPDAVNLEAAKIAKSAGVPVILDAGGADGPILEELLKCVTILSPNESELMRLTSMPTSSSEEVLQAVTKVQEMGVTQVLVKMGENGSVLVCDQEPPVFQPAILAPTVVDTTGAGDTFTAAYAVALIERQTPAEALRFAAASASICVRGKGAMPSMPKRKAVLELLKEHPVVAEESFSFPSVGSGHRTRASLGGRMMKGSSSSSASLSMKILHEGSILRVRGLSSRKVLPGAVAAASRFKLPACEGAAAHQVLLGRFGVFAL